MTKKLRLALFTLFISVLLSAFSTNIFAQKTESLKTEQPTKQCSGEKFVMPPSIAVGDEAFLDYIRVASLPATERKTAFRGLSNEQKASFIKVNLALQLVKRPDMTKDQQAFVLDAISKVSADLYDKANIEKVRFSEQKAVEIEKKALQLFQYKELGDFIEPLITNKDSEITLLQKYEDLLKNGMNARKKLVREMPVNEKVNIWKTQLAYHLATGNFSKVQREFILTMITSLTPEIFTYNINLSKEESAKHLEILDRKIQSVFSKAEEFAIFEAVGIQKFVSDQKENNSLMDPYVFCNCNWYCGSGQSCGGSCNVEVRECGPFGLSWCTSKCVVDIID